MFCNAPSARAVNARELEKIALSLGYEVEKSENPYEATLNALRVSTEEDLIVAAGSFYNISEIRRAVKESEEQQS